MNIEAILDAARRADGSEILSEVMIGEGKVVNADHLGVVQLGMRYRADELILKMAEIIEGQDKVIAGLQANVDALTALQAKSAGTIDKQKTVMEEMAGLLADLGRLIEPKEGVSKDLCEKLSRFPSLIRMEF